MAEELKLDIKDFGVQVKLDANDRMLITVARNQHYAGSVTVGDFIAQFISGIVSEYVGSGFAVTDEHGNIGLKVDNEGMDVFKLSPHFEELIKVIIAMNATDNRIVDYGIRDTDEYGFYITDESGYVVFKFDEMGIDAPLLSPHFKTLVASASGSGGGNSYKDFEYLSPSYLFRVDNRVYANNIIQRFNSEKFVRASVRFPKVNNGYFSIACDENILTGGSKSENLLTVKLSQEANDKEYSLPITLKRVFSGACTNPVRLLVISDSYGEGAYSWPDGSVREDYSFFSYSQMLGMIDDVENAVQGRFTTIGSRNHRTTQFGYKDTKYTLSAYAEARSGISTPNYARHVVLINTASVGWCILNLHKSHGAYTTEKSYLVWDTPSTEIDAGCIINESTYRLALSGYENPPAWDETDSVKALAVNWYNDLLYNRGPAQGNSARNPFFNPDKAGDFKFDFQYYLNNYKTHADDGVTPLIPGSTAGSMISAIDGNIHVCTPTHVCMVLGTNDVTVVYNAETTYRDIKAMADDIRSVTGAKVSFIFPPAPGTCYPERYPDVCTLTPWASHDEAKFEYYKQLSAHFGNFASQEDAGFYFIPAWFVMDSASSSPNYKEMKDNKGNEVTWCYPDRIHHGRWGYRDLGYQIYAWCNYTSV